jgi:hypothetical protein
MLGMAMNLTEHTHNSILSDPAGAFPVIVDGSDNLLVDDCGDNEYEEDTYKPRPQLPKPFV